LKRKKDSRRRKSFSVASRDVFKEKYLDSKFARRECWNPQNCFQNGRKVSNVKRKKKEKKYFFIERFSSPSQLTHPEKLNSHVSGVLGLGSLEFRGTRPKYLGLGFLGLGVGG